MHGGLEVSWLVSGTQPRLYLMKLTDALLAVSFVGGLAWWYMQSSLGSLPPRALAPYGGGEGVRRHVSLAIGKTSLIAAAAALAVRSHLVRSAADCVPHARSCGGSFCGHSRRMHKFKNRVTKLSPWSSAVCSRDVVISTGSV